MTSNASRRDYPEARVLGVVLLIGGAAWLAHSAGLIALPIRAVLSVLLIVLGAGMIAIRRSGGALVLAGFLLILILATYPIQSIPFEGPIGERIEAPTLPGELEREYRLAIGSLHIDLSEIELPEGVTRLDASVVIGELILIVPSDVEILGEGSAVLGDVKSGGLSIGEGARVKGSFAGRRDVVSATKLDLNLSVGLGEIEVVRAER